jgi:hypothetical protein
MGLGALSQRQRRELRDDGYVVLESFFQGAELAGIVEGLEASILARSQQAPVSGAEDGGGGWPLNVEWPERVEAVPQVFLDLVDHPRILPYVVDAIGWNIQLRDALFSPVPPRASAATPTKLRSAWHFDQEEEFGGVTHDGVMPLVDLKVSYYLSDHTEPGHACTLVVPGSHKWTPDQRSTWESWVKPEDVVALRVPVGSVMLWRSSLLHAVAPHLADSPRYHLYYAYIPRWVKPSFRSALSTAKHPDPTTDPDLMARCSPIRRQLLGAVVDAEDPSQSTPSAPKHYWFPDHDAQVPLKAWAEAQMTLPAIGEPVTGSISEAVGGGATGYGVSFSRVLGVHGKQMDKMTPAERVSAAHAVFGPDSPQLARMAEGLGYRNFANSNMHKLWSAATQQSPSSKL